MSEADLRSRLDSVTVELLSTYEEIEVLTTVAEIAASTADVAVVGQRLLEEAAGLLQAEVAFIFYTDTALKGEEPPPTGISAAERDALATALGRWLGDQPRPAVMAPFQEGAGIPHAPDALAAVPLKSEGLVLGALCLGKRGDGATFTAGDLKILSVLGGSAASVLVQRRNLDLTRVSRRLEERNLLLKGILEVSREIAASLDRDRLLHALANLPTKALGFDRCAVLLEDASRRRLRAVSGLSRVDRAEPELASLERLLDWTAGRGVQVVANLTGEGEVVADPPEAAAQAGPHMKLSGANSMLAIPLKDDQGMLGVLSFESGTTGFVDETRLEGATILANQATVALRNAQLYGDVPLIGLLRPLRGGLSRVAGLPRRRLAAWGVGAAIVLAILVLGRWDLKVPGQVTVMPSSVALVSSRVRGVVREVGQFREGDRVTRGAVLAKLEAPDLGMRLNEAKAREQTALRGMAKLEAEGRAAELSLARVEAERWKGESDNLRARLEETTLRAPIDGIVLTPRLQERAGELLEVGGVFCTLADTSRLRVEIAVPERDADVLVLGGNAGVGGNGSNGQEGAGFVAALKFNSFPERDYHAGINKVRSSAEMVEGTRSLVVEGEVEQPGGAADGLRPGMTGRARIDAGPRPIITILLRRPYRFLRSLIWL